VYSNLTPCYRARRAISEHGNSWCLTVNAAGISAMTS
jgi:hypothetical protein